MEFLDIVAILLSLAAVFAYLNHKLLKLPMAIGVMLIGLVMSLVLVLVGTQIPDVQEQATKFLKGIDFNDTLMKGMLSYLLFAGALHVNFKDLMAQKWLVAIMASFGVALSTFLVGSAAYFLFQALGINIHYMWCLVFGALISPTDPVAVLGILKKVGAPKSLETKITGESLFNDGVGVVIYIALVGIAGAMTGFTVGGHGGDHGVMGVVKLFALEAGGGVILGLVLGGIGYKLLKSIDNYHVEILITLALVTAGYRLALCLHTSGPLAMVVAGLLTGNPARNHAMSDTTRENLDVFWELVDEILNAVLFLLIGLELLILTFSGNAILAGVIMIPICLIVRYSAAWIPVQLLKKRKEFSPGVVKILTWGGIRGGISVALALGIPEDVPGRDTILLVTYIIVIFSIAVQGLTLKGLIQRNLNKV